MQMVHCPHCANVIATPTANRLERILLALLESDYVKEALLEPHRVAAMARALEHELNQIEKLSPEQFKHYCDLNHVP
jgi:hypothetical protein